MDLDSDMEYQVVSESDDETGCCGKMKNSLSGIKSQFKVHEEENLNLQSIDKYFVTNNFVSIFVGDVEQPWVLPEKLLCDHSPFFQAALKGGFQESCTKEVRLREANPLGFPLFVQWILTRRLRCPEEHDLYVADVDHCLPLCSVYVLADMLDMKKLAMHAVDQVRRCMSLDTRLPSIEEVTYVYDNTMEGSSMQECFVDEMVVAFLSKDSFADTNREMLWIEAVGANRKFHQDVMDAIKEHTLLEVCSVKECSVHKDRNGVRARRLVLERRKQRQCKGLGIRHV
ncbi:uncharacterized protein LY89DRAFT_724594 [Mollisia scopiformis]|uniref:BTB domain-containing protein n=1 Tax=Mollisia scopiformis TaxID=149040 RepID=A0A132B9H9_MOLSC|nr:uncharacterized protein LY89DRAFT_724594 [Mollisia scopiformis]KUJ09058.1 hypothetical protein LY89DRAFT_724594 [Mollisia scopiformis]